jgi:predicted homoserine dehydrogenase-like protein
LLRSVLVLPFLKIDPVGVVLSLCCLCCVALYSGRAVCSSINPLMQWEGIEVILEVTGAVEFGARVALEAFAHKKHVIAMNAELDGTLGPLLKVRRLTRPLLQCPPPP